MRHLLRPLPILMIAAVGYGCSDDAPDAGTADTGGGADAGIDAGTSDTGTTPDSGTDAGADAGTVDTGSGTFPRFSCADVTTGTCVAFSPGQEDDLLDAVNTLADNTTIVLASGRFALDNAVTIRLAHTILFTGQGIDVTVLDFAAQTTQSNGVDVVADDFTISHLTVTDSRKDGVRIEDSDVVKIQYVKATWSGGPLTTNGAYGIYPVRVSNLLMEHSEAYNAADAGLYVGQCRDVIVRRNTAKQNVAGLEIENTQFVDVYDNLVEDNAAGLLIFDLPGNPIFGRDIRIYGNTILRNNRPNFAVSGTTVSQIPRGTGTFALASRRLEIMNNTYTQNNTTDIAILSGLAIVSSTGAWAIPIGQVNGSTVGLELVRIGNSLLNFRTTQIYVHDNVHSGGGGLPDANNKTARPLGALLAILYFDGTRSQVDTLLYDGIGEIVDPAVAGNNTNLNHLCISNETGATYATLDLPKLGAMIANNDIPNTSDIYRPAEPYVPFNCAGFTNGAVVPVILPFPIDP